MFSNILSRERQRLLELLGQKHITDGFYLAGGTAAALYLGHRISEDFVFFLCLNLTMHRLSEILVLSVILL